MPILLPAILSILLSQTTPNTVAGADTDTNFPRTHINTIDCQVYWMSQQQFGSILELELSALDETEKKIPIEVTVQCYTNQATVRIALESATPQKAPETQTIYLHDTHENMRTRTLALAVFAAAKDFIDGVLSPPENKTPPAAETAVLPETQRPQETQDSPTVAFEELLQNHHTGYHGSMGVSAMSALRYLHPALAVRGMLHIHKWRLGIFAAGMHFNEDLGKVWGGLASIYAGRTVFDFITLKGMIGELNVGLYSGVVHGRAYASDEGGKDYKRTRLLTGAEAEFAFYLSPERRITVGFNLYSGWMLGISFAADNKTFGEFNSIYAGLGAVIMFGS